MPGQDEKTIVEDPRGKGSSRRDVGAAGLAWDC